MQADVTSEELRKSLSNNIEDYPEGIILPIDKPYRWTSADVIRKIKFAACRHFGSRKLKVGHAGTLDPLATGLLLVCIGPATRRAEQLQASAKEYVAGVSFGATTPSYDLEKEPDATYPIVGVSSETIESRLAQMTGPQMQVAPLFSAKSIDGVRAYETARRLFRQGRLEEGSELIQASQIELKELELLSFDPNHHFEAPQSDARGRINVADISSREFPTAQIRIACSKGTYIRAFARDLGEALGSGAFLSSLRRTKNGGFTLEDAISLEDALEMLSNPASL